MSLVGYQPSVRECAICHEVRSCISAADIEGDSWEHISSNLVARSYKFNKYYIQNVCVKCLEIAHDFASGRVMPKDSLLYDVPNKNELGVLRELKHESDDIDPRVVIIKLGDKEFSDDDIRKWAAGNDNDFYPTKNELRPLLRFLSQALIVALKL